MSLKTEAPAGGVKKAKPGQGTYKTKQNKIADFLSIFL